LVTNPWQPRRRADPARLQELANDIGARGVLEPLIVRHLADDQYQIIAGERRFRAAELAGLVQVPCLVRDVDEAEARAIALVENLQREDLDIEDEARFLKELHDGGMSLRDIGATIHKSYQYVNRRVKLAADPAALQAYRDGHLNLDSLITDRVRPVAGVPMGELAAAAQAAADELFGAGEGVTPRNTDDAPGARVTPRNNGAPGEPAARGDRLVGLLQRFQVTVRQVQLTTVPAQKRAVLRETVTALIGELTVLAEALDQGE